MAITFSSSDQNLPPAKSQTYLKGLRGHLESKGSGLIERVPLTAPMDFLVIVDFGTRGLEGDIREDEDRGTEEKKNDFFCFWRNIGRAVEGTTVRGRWGLGKTVFQAASRIDSFFGLTIRRSGPRKLLMGQSVLKIHWCNGSKYGPYGYYGIFDGDFGLPFDEKPFIEQFIRDLRLRRTVEPGLSVIVPYPDNDISPSEIIRAVVRQYFFPVLSGDLVVVVVAGHHEQVLDGGSIFEFVSRSEMRDKDIVAHSPPHGAVGANPMRVFSPASVIQ